VIIVSVLVVFVIEYDDAIGGGVFELFHLGEFVFAGVCSTHKLKLEIRYRERLTKEAEARAAATSNKDFILIN